MQLRPLSLAEIGLDNGFDSRNDLVVGDRRPQQAAQADVLRTRTAECELIKLLALLIDTEDSDMTDVMVSTRVDTARNLDLKKCPLAGNHAGGGRRAIEVARGGAVCVAEACIAGA